MYKPNIIMGDAQAFEDIVYGHPTNNLANYIGASMRALGSYITDRSRDFFSNANRVYQQFTGEQARPRIYISDDTLSLMTEDNYNNLSNINKRYLMVDPEIYRMKEKGSIGAFDNVYEDRDSYVTDVYWKRDYLEVNSGLVYIEDDKAKYSSTLVNDHNLSFSEQLIIKNNWAVAKKLMADDIDVTENIL